MQVGVLDAELGYLRQHTFLPPVTVNNEPKFIVIFNVILTHKVCNLTMYALWRRLIRIAVKDFHMHIWRAKLILDSIEIYGFGVSAFSGNDHETGRAYTFKADEIFTLSHLCSI